MLASLISDQSISIMQATPATWKMLLADNWEGNQELKVLCGGEALPADLARQLVGKVGSLWNMYGPTETTIWSTCRQVDPAFSRITVGRPIDNTQIYIMDEAGLPLPATVPGELCIGGRGVALGYHNLPELTAEKFTDSPQLGRIYRTGDLARVLPDGDIEHLGRIDDQVKVRGFRIELGEIETVLQAHPDVDQAAAYVWSAKEDDQRIVACCVAAPGQNISAIKLRKHLRANLPEYMVPQYFLPVDAIRVDAKRESGPTQSAESRRVGKPTGPPESRSARDTCRGHHCRYLDETDSASACSAATRHVLRNRGPLIAGPGRAASDREQVRRSSGPACPVCPRSCGHR